MKRLQQIKHIAIIGLLLLAGCKKQDSWLEQKTNKNDVVPETVDDYQAIMDNTLEMNSRGFSVAGLVGSDNINVTDNELSSMWEQEINLYLWKPVIWLEGLSDEWNYGYRMIAFSNLVLEGINKASGDDLKVKNVKGQAYFFRAAAMYNLAQLFCTPFVKNKTEQSPGLPIRETSDVNALVKQRSSIEKTYTMIINDLKVAIELLPTGQPYQTRPTSIAAEAMLAKVYLSMSDYENAGKYASEALNSYKTLLDFNSNLVSKTAVYPFPKFGIGNPEIIFYAQAQSYNAIRPYDFSPGSVSKELYDLYDPDDLRKSVFFILRSNEIRLNGTYTGSYSNFCGIATNELYLIRAEAYVRKGNVEGAQDDINDLLKNRFKTGKFHPIETQDGEVLLKIILQERRKELPFTGNLRWEDLRRLNNEAKFAKTLKRVSKAITYELSPNDKRYVMPIPQTELTISGLEQNER